LGKLEKNQWRLKRRVLVLLAGLLVLLAVDSLAAGEGFGRRRRNRGQARYLQAVDNPVYKEQCGACHMAYQPALLPAGSWRKIMAGLDEHGGVGVELEEGDRKTISRYLESNAAEHSSCRHAALILKSLKGQTPLKITQVPYIRDLHRSDDIPPGVFERKSVGSRANCLACHPRAGEGFYRDVRVPE
jgi:hypothetical protein